MSLRLESCSPFPVIPLQAVDVKKGPPIAASVLPLTPIPDVDAYQLIRRVAAGDLVAFETLYRHYTPRLMSYLQPRLGPSESAEEVCQDVFLAVWNNASKFQPLAPLSAWIFEIAQRLVLKARTRDVKPVHEVAAMAETEINEENPEASLFRQTHHRLVTQAVAALPPVLRQTVTLRYYQECSYREIATRMGCAETTVKNRLRQAKRRLGAALRRRGHRYAMAV
ncbi:RNA polymerase sigma factor [Candidatus Entotheonella palauensis]|uniref:RNA polymerase sigma factor n=1 Tax=Candidatus Entotheonella palauensis TaxID=93172 RepID=UPI000B7FAC90|nr:sigma-70 family RNA polymerase sigma factor [Candidatus Entotheonella palauensis]